MAIRGTHVNISICPLLAGGFPIMLKQAKTRFFFKGRLYQHLGLWPWCPECLPAARWHGRWETHAACRENVQESQSCPDPPAQARLLGTFGSVSHSLDEEERLGPYAEGKEKTSVEWYKQQKSEVNAPPILSMTDPSTRPAHVSNTNTLLPAWMFARVNIWARVSYRRWLRDTETSKLYTRLSRLIKRQKSHILFIRVLTHQIFTGSRPWYIIARMRHDGFRIVTVLSYLKNAQGGTADNTNYSTLHLALVCNML